MSFSKELSLPVRLDYLPHDAHAYAVDLLKRPYPVEITQPIKSTNRISYVLTGEQTEVEKLYQVINSGYSSYLDASRRGYHGAVQEMFTIAGMRWHAHDIFGV